jgi:D-ribose pyranase
MKRTGLLHPELLAVVGELGHLDELLICDAGYPIPTDMARIDLAYRPGQPPFLDVVRAVAAELVLEGAVVDAEATDALVAEVAAATGVAQPNRIPHAELQVRARGARAAVRTGEFTPYANVLLVCGVAF